LSNLIVELTPGTENQKATGNSKRPRN